MKLHLTIQRTDAPDAPPVSHELPVSALPASLGEDAAATLTVPGLPAQTVLISRGTGTSLRVRLLHGDLEARHQGQPLAPGQDQELRSGDELIVGPWRLRVQVVFPRAGHARATGWLPALSLATIVVLLGAELAIGLWLPWVTRARANWGIEVARQRTYALLDQLRVTVNRTRRIPLEASPLATCEMIGEELDRIAFHLRTYEDRLDARQMAQVYADLIEFRRVLRSLAEGTFYPPPPRLLVDEALHSILQQEPDTP